MNRTILIAALAGVTALPVITDSTSTAHADVVIKAKAKVRIGGRTRVRLRAPRIHRVRPHVRVRPRVRVHVRPRVRYRLRVGGYYGYRYAAPPPPRCNYECAPTTAAYYAPARTVGVYARPRRHKRFGIGLFAGGMNVEDREASSDVGVLARFRLTRSLALEGEVAKSELDDGSRVDRRIGASLLYDFAPRSRLSPHILIGGGVVRSDIESERNLSADQAYGEVGVGLGWRLSRSFEIAADVRAGSREANGEDEVFLSSEPMPIKEDEGYTRARLSAILYF